MKLKNKVIAAIATELFVLLILPFLFLQLSKPHEAMAAVLPAKAPKIKDTMAMPMRAAVTLVASASMPRVAEIVSSLS